MKGKRIKAKAIVASGYWLDGPYWKLYSGQGNSETYRAIYRYEKEITGICLGWSVLNEGVRYAETNWGYQTSTFQPKKQHKVYVIEPDCGDNRYYQPVRVLLEDVVEE